MFLPCKYNTTDGGEGWINTDHIVDVLFDKDSVIAYTAYEHKCSYIIDIKMWQSFLLSFVEEIVLENTKSGDNTTCDDTSFSSKD